MADLSWVCVWESRGRNSRRPVWCLRVGEQGQGFKIASVARRKQVSSFFCMECCKPNVTNKYPHSFA
eukprot:scaffold56653_cov14-Tisochrysis_lutea.AAC.2